MKEDAIDRIVGQWNRERPDLDVSATHVLQRITRIYLLHTFRPRVARVSTDG